MSGIFRSLFLGLLLIAATSALLLLSDLRSRVKPPGPGETSAARSAAPDPDTARVQRVAVVQHNTQPIFDAGVQGILDGLAEAGFHQGHGIDIRKFNPLGDSNLANAIAVEVAQGGYDLVLTATTPSLQTIANANRSRQTPHLFALVADPSATGVGVVKGDPLAHPAHLSGVGTRLPVTSAFRIAREINPALKTVGVLWNNSEVNSEVQLHDAREICRELGIALIEVNVDSTNAVAEAAAVLVSREIEALFIPGDITVLGAVNNVLQIARRAGLPVFSLFPSNSPKGELFNVGADYYQVGRKTGQLAAEVLRGRAIATIPIENYVPEKLAVNEQAVSSLRHPERWRIPAALRDRAVLVVDADGKLTDRSPPVVAPTAAAPARPLPPKTIAVAYYAPEPSWQDCYQGLLDELRVLGYAEGKNLVIRGANTQGEAANILPILHNHDSSDADALVTFSTPILQGALATIRNKPVVFTYVTDPIAAGAGRSWTDHDPRFTGVGTMIPVAETVAMIRKVFPQLKRLGTLFNAGEVNSTRVIELLRVACRDAGIELVEISIASTSEAIQAAQALTSRNVEAVYLPNDNMVYQAFPAMVQTLDRARLPVINGDPAYVGRGVFASVGPGYYAAGQAAAHKLVRILAGEKPALIPMENVSVQRVAFDRTVARKLGLSVDEAVLKALETPAPSAPAPSAATPAPAQAAKPPLKLAFAFLAPEPGVESCMSGVIDGLRELGYEEGKNLSVRRAHASGDVSHIAPMLQNFDHSDIDVIVPFTTSVLQAASLQVKRKPVVFTYVTDPVAAGAGRSLTDHLPHLTGVGSFPPLEDTLDVIRRVHPGFKRLGLLYNSGESNSSAIVAKLRDLCRARGIEVAEVTAATSGEMLLSAQALVARRPDVIYLPSDNTANLAFDAIADTARRASIPLYIDDAEFLDRGALAAIGPGYYYSGKAAAGLIARVAAGEHTAAIPMADVSVRIVKFNREVAARLGVPEALVRELETAPPALAASAAAPAAPAPKPALKPLATGRKMRVDVITYVENAPTEETLAGLAEGLAKGPLLPGRDFDVRIRSAQGDMSTLSSLVDASLTDRVDLIVPLSSPSFQVALSKTRSGTPPVVFGMVANPLAAGGGKSYEDHLPHVTGISVLGPAPRMVDLLIRHFPQFKRIGTLYCPAEINSVDIRDYLVKSAAARGIVVESVAVNSPTELVDAATSLASRKIDAIVQVSDNLSNSGFTAISRAARAARMPLISMNSTTVSQGAGLAMGHDYHDVGLTTADRVQRVLGGENPATIPFSLPNRISLVIHPANARANGLVIPDALLKEADIVIRD